MTDRFKYALDEWKSMPFALTNKQAAQWVEKYQGVIHDALKLATEAEQLRKEVETLKRACKLAEKIGLGLIEERDELIKLSKQKDNWK